MNIYILTLHWVPNFGANLQAFSTYKYLSDLGHRVKVIDYRDNKEIKDYSKICSKEQYQSHLTFVTNNLNLTKTVHDLEGIETIIKEDKPDVVIVGSDAVWRQEGSKLLPYWLASEELKKVHTIFFSLAVSLMGSNILNLKDSIKEEIKTTLLKFKYISLRDDWSLYQIKTFRDKCVTFCPDPVLLLNKNEMLPILNSDVEKLIDCKEKYILVSISKSRLNNVWFRILKKLLNSKGYKLVELPMPEGNRNIKSDYSIKLPLNSNDWFLSIANASGYIGERFHAMVSCINNNTPFVIIDTYGTKLPSLKNKKSKIYDLAKRVDMLDFIIHKRNILLYNPIYVFRKIMKSIKMNNNSDYIERTLMLKSNVRNYINQICLK